MSGFRAWADLRIRVDTGGRAEQRVACPNCAKSDRDDTLGVNIETGTYHCFRCGMRGRAGFRATHIIETRVTRFDDPAVVQRKRERLGEF